MPKPASFMLCWSEERGIYELYEHGQLVTQAQGMSWLTWLDTHTSFSFRGQHGHLNVLKERRQQSTEGYWYAYQRQGKRTKKRYVGKSVEVMLSRLEEIGRSLQERPSAFPLLMTKFQYPIVSSQLVYRKRLLTLLDAGRQCSLTLLTAQAGSGKTTLVAQWIAEQKRKQEHFFPIAWVSLDKQDNDIVRFWRYVITACSLFQKDCGQKALRQIAAMSSFPPETAFIEGVLAHFLNDLTQATLEGVLVLDDYQVITSSHIQQTFAFFLAHLPPSVHVILISRSEVTFSLAQLRARGVLNEIDARDLRFSREETLTFFQCYAPSMPVAGMIESLELQLEGWASGLRLLAHALQREATGENVEQYLARFAREHRPLHDYFIEEIFEKQSTSQQAFLLHTCWFDRMNASLCQAVTGRQDSATVLRSLERAGLFLEYVDDTGRLWYRYYTLFVQAMREEARRRLGEETIQATLLRASCWYEQEGCLTEAIELTLQAQEPDKAAQQINHYLAQQGYNDMREFATLRRWLEQLPMDILAHYPLLCLHYAQVLALSFVPESPPPDMLVQMEQLLQRAETSWQAQGNMEQLGEVYAFRAYVATQQHAPEQAYDDARQALAWLPETSQRWRAICLNHLGAGEISWGHLERAQKWLQEALAIWDNLHYQHGARSCTLLLAQLYFEQGALQLAAACYRRVVQEARELGDREDLVPALIGLAQILYEWNDIEAAERIAQEAWDTSEYVGNRELLLRSACVLLQIWVCQGQHLAVQQRLIALLARFSAYPELFNELHLFQLSCYLTQGGITMVQQRLPTLLIDNRKAYARVRERQQLVQARLLHAQKEYSQAFNVLAKLQKRAQEEGRGRLLLEIQLCIVRVYLAEKQVDAAHQTLDNALQFAHREGYLRSFLDEGKEIAALLRQLRVHIKEAPLLRYVQTILYATGPEQGSASLVTASLEPLSDQEQRVLRLVVAEYSYPEIARELTVSVNTVKTHINHIYRKLNVHSRREARAVVKRLQLFSTESSKNHERR